jgi:hypothetical protein
VGRGGKATAYQIPRDPATNAARRGLQVIVAALRNTLDIVRVSYILIGREELGGPRHESTQLLATFDARLHPRKHEMERLPVVKFDPLNFLVLLSRPVRGPTYMVYFLNEQREEEYV